MKKIEIIAAIIAAIALTLNLFLIPFGGMLTVLSFSTLSMLYFYLSFALFNNIEFSGIFKSESYKEIKSARIIGAVGTGFALSAAIVGLMFKFNSWPGADINLTVGLLGLSVVSIIGLIKYSKSQSEYYTNIFKRAAVVGGLALTMMLLPKGSWFDFKYRDYPDYVQAMRNARANPENKELWDIAEMERQKMNEGKNRK